MRKSLTPLLLYILVVLLISANGLGILGKKATIHPISNPRLHKGDHELIRVPSKYSSSSKSSASSPISSSLISSTDLPYPVVGRSAKIFKKRLPNQIDSIATFLSRESRLWSNFLSHHPDVNFIPQGSKLYPFSKKTLAYPIVRGKNNVPIVIDERAPVIGVGFEGTVVSGYVRSSLNGPKIQRVAVKIVDYDPHGPPKKSLGRETRNLAKSSLLHSPTVTDAGTGKAFIPMKYVKGEVLEKKAIRVKDEQGFMDLARETESLVTQFHKTTGMAHNDLHANNIILPMTLKSGGSGGGGLVDLSRAVPLNTKFGKGYATEMTDITYLRNTLADLAAMRFGPTTNLVKTFKEASLDPSSPLPN